MKCYTYASGDTLSGIDIHGENQKTCQIIIKLPCDWNMQAFMAEVKAMKRADTLLHCVAELVGGEAESSLFTSDCVTVSSNEIMTLENVNSSCLEVIADADRVVYVLFTGSELYDNATGKYIYNDNGELVISDSAHNAWDGEDLPFAL